jgi:hypothetical protein
LTAVVFVRSARMNKRNRVKYVHEGKYAVEVNVELLEDETAWSPYLSVDDACRLDDAREALRREDISAASHIGRVFELQPVTASQ